MCHSATTATPYMQPPPALYVPPLPPFTSHHRPTLGTPAFHPLLPHAPYLCPPTFQAHHHVPTCRRAPSGPPQHSYIPPPCTGRPHNPPRAPPTQPGTPLMCLGPLLRAVPELSGPRVQVGLDLEFGRTWLQQAGCCADSSFTSGISVAGRGLIARSDGEKGREVGSYECGVESISR